MEDLLMEMSDDEKTIEAMSDEEKARYKAEKRWANELMLVRFLSVPVAPVSLIINPPEGD